jgi:hypothetical protein
MLPTTGKYETRACEAHINGRANATDFSYRWSTLNPRHPRDHHRAGRETISTNLEIVKVTTGSASKPISSVRFYTYLEFLVIFRPTLYVFGIILLSSFASSALPPRFPLTRLALIPLIVR